MSNTTIVLLLLLCGIGLLLLLFWYISHASDDKFEAAYQRIRAERFKKSTIILYYPNGTKTVLQNISSYDEMSDGCLYINTDKETIRFHGTYEIKTPHVRADT